MKRAVRNVSEFPGLRSVSGDKKSVTGRGQAGLDGGVTRIECSLAVNCKVIAVVFRGQNWSRHRPDTGFALYQDKRSLGAFQRERNVAGSGSLQAERNRVVRVHLGFGSLLCESRNGNETDSQQKQTTHEIPRVSVAASRLRFCAKA